MSHSGTIWPAARSFTICVTSYWTEDERAAFHDYMNQTVDAQRGLGNARIPQRLVRIQELGDWAGLLRDVLREPAGAEDSA